MDDSIGVSALHMAAETLRSPILHLSTYKNNPLNEDKICRPYFKTEDTQ